VLIRREALQHLVADGLRAHALDEGLHDAEVHVRLEQRQPDLPQRRVDGGLRQPRLAPERSKDPLQPGTERLEHDRDPDRGPASRLRL
jgi:hypothetical protein